jgi:hypothetical protein
MQRNTSFDDWASEYMVCTEFAAAYFRKNENITIKYGEVDGNEHCWVYDAKLDQTIDATLGQFFIPGAKDDWWNGEEHPMAEETDEFHSIEEFAKGPGGTALLEA